MTESNIGLPVWLHESWNRAVRSIDSDHLSHASLLAGPTGVGKRLFAEALAGYILCLNKPGEASLLGKESSNGAESNDQVFPGRCGQCKSCLLLEAGSHPDLLHIEPEDSRAIKINQVRRLTEVLYQRPQISEAVVALVWPAEAMNHYAANALLKTLEEPASSSFIFLISEQPSLLLPTIRSRCQISRFGIPGTEQSVDWVAKHTGLPDEEVRLLLTAAGGQPLTAVEWHDKEMLTMRKNVLAGWVDFMAGRQDAFSIASQWSKFEQEWVINWLLGWCRQMHEYRLSLRPENLESALREIADRLQTDTLWKLYQEALEAKRFLLEQRNLNMQLVFENWLMLNKKKATVR